MYIGRYVACPLPRNHIVLYDKGNRLLLKQQNAFDQQDTFQNVIIISIIY